MNDRADRAEDFEIGPDGQLRRKDNKQPTQLLGDRFNRNQDGSLRWDGGSTTSHRSVLQDAKTLVASGLVLDGNTSVEADDMSNELRAQPRKPVFESDAVRAAMGLPTSTPETATPDRPVPVNALFPDGPRRGDGIAETSRAAARRESRTPAFDSDTVRNGSSKPMHEDTAGDARAKAQAAARCPIWDNDAKRSA